ncbi:WD40-repeat-containing domain [Pseudocohnilembus persalinus]|uniref:WD40-repeat-containing domain n=1 Tax=Pseudocohnilembus persalinus TaxID=266149 RepID=A0A0V0QY33_PSEPJ|nr:WD40-repeat-containing domain [Pseudocohnilembus persalinus]|eukprot:KRX07260.1 WD40-repeat-containing domain [Pseudocohnilembus persalinus]
MSNNLVSALCWIKKGYAASNPKEFDLQEEDIELIKGDPTIQESIKQAQEIQKQSDKEKKKNIKQQKMEDEWEEQDYEDGDELDEENYAPVFTSEFGMLKNGMPQFNDGYDFQIDEISNEDKEDYQIQPTDSLMVAAKIEKEFSSLEVYVYEQDKSSLFVHHEIQLSAFPLALEWLPLNPLTFENGSAKQGNFVIVGTFLPEIEFWNLDVLNAIEPSIIMGGEIDQQQMQQQQMKKGKKVKQFNQSQQLFKEGSHTDSVLALNLNGFRQNILASGSADNTVKIWDISQQKNMHTFKTHTGKVQVVSWNKAQEAVLLSGGYDRNIVIQDVRQPQNAIIHQLQSEIESGGWCPYEENILYTSTEDGYLISKPTINKLLVYLLIKMSRV